MDLNSRTKCKIDQENPSNISVCNVKAAIFLGGTIAFQPFPVFWSTSQDKCFLFIHLHADVASSLSQMF